MFRSEPAFVNWLRRRARPRHPGLRLGIGDDAALLRVGAGRELVLTTDLSIEGIHFARRLHSARSVGHRALARSLSDIAAMGARPRFVFVSLALARKTTRHWAEEFYDGLLVLARKFGADLAGGDAAVVPDKAFVDVVVAGEVERGRALTRAGARPGDRIFVSGRLGMSALGLQRLKSGGRNEGSSRTASLPLTRPQRAAIRAHLYPEPRCRLGRLLVERRLATSAIDLSDGLSTDLWRLCEASGVGARLWAERIPAPEVRGHPRERLLSLALNGGEDYELLFTVPRQLAARIPSRLGGVPLRPIGEILRSKEVSLVREDGWEVPLRPGGFDHFRLQRDR